MSATPTIRSLAVAGRILSTDRIKPIFTTESFQKLASRLAGPGVHEAHLLATQTLLQSDPPVNIFSARLACRFETASMTECSFKVSFSFLQIPKR